MVVIYKKLDLDKFFYLIGNIYFFFLFVNIKMVELLEVDFGKVLKRKWIENEEILLI